MWHWGLDLDQGDGLAISSDQVTGLAHQGGGARGAGEGDHQHRGLGWGCLLQGTVQQLAIAQGPGGGVHRTSGEGKGAAQPHSQRPCAA